MRYRRPIHRPVRIDPPHAEPRMVKCDVAVTCPDCDGAGSYYVQMQGRPETKRVAECETCHGLGEIIE